MVKKLALVWLSIAILGTTVACGTNSSSSTDINSTNNETKTIIEIASAGEADMTLFESFSEVENIAPIIVEAQRMGEPAQNSTKGEDGTVLETWTVTEVKINRVYKGDVKASETLKVAEPGYYDDNGTYITYEGYKVMGNDDRYLLALRLGAADEYIIIGMYQGKFDLDNKSEAEIIMPGQISKKEFEDADYVGEDPARFNKLKKEVLTKYAG